MGSLVGEAQSYSQRAFEFLDRVEYRRAETDRDKDAIYRLRYRAYFQENAIAERFDQRLSDRFDNAPNSWLFGIHVDGTLMSSLRICVATWRTPDTPAVDAFPDLLKPEIAKGKIIVDPNRFVAEPALAARYTMLPYMTLRLAYLACEHFDADIGTATVRKEHEAFYRRTFLHASLCEPRPYPTLTKPLGLMAVDHHKMRERVFQRYPFFQSKPGELSRLFLRNTVPSADPLRRPAGHPFLAQFC